MQTPLLPAIEALADIDPQRIAMALALIGRNETLRELFVLAILAAEKELKYSGVIREEVTGPIVDALYSGVERVHKRLSTGEIFEFPYRSKIAREFVMSEPRLPDHAWEPQTTKLLLQLSESAKHVLIGGAYFGDHAILVAKKIAVWGGVCHAFEPNQEESRILAHNAELNALQNIKVQRFGLWSKNNCSLKLVGSDSHAHPELASATDDDAFPTVTIDSYLEHQGVTHLDLIMLDIEGGELDALKGAVLQLSLSEDEAPALVFEVHRNYVDWSNGLENTEIVRLVSGFGYTLFALRDFNANYCMAGKPIELIPLSDVYLEGPPHGFNVLALKGPKKRTLLGDYKISPNVSPKLLLHRNPDLHHPSGGLGQR